MPQQSHARVWALLGPHRGDNNQVLALAEALGLPFEEKKLSYNGLRGAPPRLLGATFASVDALSRRQLEGEPPELTISTGLRSVPVVRELKRRSGGRTGSNPASLVSWPGAGSECQRRPRLAGRRGV